MGADKVELKFLSILDTDGDIGEWAEASGDAIYGLGGILRHVADRLSTALHHAPTILHKVDMTGTTHDGIEDREGQGLAIQVNYFIALHCVFKLQMDATANWINRARSEIM